MATYISFIGKGQLFDKSKNDNSADVFAPSDKEQYQHRYRETEYRFEERNKTVTASLFTNAVMSSGLFTDRIDKVRIVGTYTSTWAQLLENPQDEDELDLCVKLIEAEEKPDLVKSFRAGLIAALRKRWNVDDIDLIMHEAGYAGYEQRILDSYLDLMMKNEGDIILDVMHGLRWMPLFLTSAMELADVLSRSRKVQILYGELTEKPCPVRILTPLWEERALSADVRLFLDKWEAEPLAHRLDSVWPSGAKAIRDLGNHLQGNYLIPLVWDTEPGNYGRPFRQLNNALSDLEKIGEKPLWLTIIADRLKSLYNKIRKHKTASGRILQLAEFYAERRMYGQALLSQDVALRMFIWEKSGKKDIPNWDELETAREMYIESNHSPKQFWNVFSSRNVVAHGALRSKAPGGGIPQTSNLPSQYEAQQKFLNRLFLNSK